MRNLGLTHVKSRKIGSPNHGNEHCDNCNSERDTSPSQSLHSQSSGSVSVHPCIDIHGSPLSRRTMFDGGFDTSSGSRGATQYESANLVRFPTRPSLASADSRGSDRELFIPGDDMCAVCALAVVLGGAIVLIGGLLFAGYEIFSRVHMT